MNEQAIQDAYNLFVSNGYKKSIDEYKKLIASNEQALNDSYSLFAQNGYKKSVDDFKGLMGITQVQPVVDKKKVATVSPLADGSLVSPTTPPEEQDYFQGAFGNVLRGLDNIIPIGIGDFVDDMARSVSAGYKQGTAAQEADKLLLQGTKATPEQIQKFINANKNAQMLGPSAEMQDYQRIYESEGKGFWGVVKGLALNPTIIPEVLTSSLTAMATNTDALTAGAAAVGTGAGIGAAAGVPVGGVGAIPGAAAGAIASVPYAFGLASSVVEMGSTFGELLQEELGNQEMTKENVKTILENPEKLNKIRNKAIARGAIIGTIDAFTGKLASGVGAKIIGKSAAKSATGAVTRGAVTRATAAGAAIEGVGGSLGEAAARGAIGQEMDVSEIALEGIAELPGGMRSTIQARFAKPSYEVNGEKVSAEQVDELINTMSPADLAKTKIDIKNDYEGRQLKIQDKIVTSSIKEQVREVNPNLSEEALDEVTSLEKELRKLEGNTTQLGKDKAAEIRSQIRDVQQGKKAETTLEQELRAALPYEYYEGQLDAEYDWQKNQAKEFLADPKAYFEGNIEEATASLEQDPNNKIAQNVLADNTEKLRIFNEITNKYKQDAIQKQAAGELPVQSRTGVSEEVEKGKPQAEPQVITEEEIERQRKEALSNIVTFSQQDGSQFRTFKEGEDGKNILRETWSLSGKTKEETVDLINKFYDEKLTALQQPQVVTEEGQVKEKVDNIESTKQALEGKNPEKLLGLVSPISAVSGEDYNKQQAEDVIDMEIKLLPDDISLEQDIERKKQLSDRLEYLSKKENREKEVSDLFNTLQNDDNDKIKNAPKLISEAYQKAKIDGSNPELVKAVENLLAQPEVVSSKTQPEVAPVVEEEVVITKDELPRYQKTTQTEVTKKLLDYFAQVTGIPKFTEDISKKTYVSWLRNASPLGYDVASKLNFPKQAFNSIANYKKELDREAAKKAKTETGVVTTETPIQYGTEQPTAKPSGPVAGNRLFSKPVTAISKIANEYYQRVFGKQRPRFFGTRKLDEARAKRISDAFIAMKHDPKNPEVRAAYDALVKETIEQYRSFVDAGYRIEINNDEPYANSQEMINDVRDNKRVKIFSTESGYGDNPITEEQRAENPLLGRTEFVDANGVPLLANDVFRAVHEVFGHAELGNSFGPKGEENAWNVHVRMFSPLAARAMTTETRGQNSYVNFSGVNDKITALREEARKLREEGKTEEADAIVQRIYEEGSFADQKMGLLPEEFSQYDETDLGDTIPEGEQLMTADTKNPTVLEKVRDFLDKAEADLDKFGRETAGINIAVPVMKAIIKTVRALVNTGISLQQAIQRAAAENNVSEQDVIDTLDLLAQQRELEGKAQGVSEVELPGYNRMMTELDGVVKKSIERGVEADKVLQNALDYLQGSRVYETASDTQREQMVRDVRKMFGKREKAAPKPEKLFGEAKDVNMITMSEYDLLTKKIKDMAKGAKDAKAIWTKTSNELTKYLKTMVDGGYLSAKQTAAVLRKFSGVNMFDENSISRFVDYMQKVFTNAAYAEQIAQIRAMLPTARKNAQTKIGVAQTLSPLMNKMLAINPALIPDSVFDKYVEIVTMMGQRKAVLELQESGQVTQTVEDILDAVDEEVSRSEELSELFDSYADKVVDEDGKLDFAATIRQMVKEEVITEEDAAIMRKYKKNIVPKTEKVEKTEEELAAEKQVLIELARDMELDSDGLPMKDERNLARELAKLIKSDAIEGLDATQLNNLIRVIDNINNGYLPHFAQLMVERLNAISNSKLLDKAVMQAKPLPLSTVYARLKSLVTDKDKFLELIRRNPLYYIDQVFGNFKTKDIFNSLFEKAAEAQSMFQRSVNEVNNKLDKAQQDVAKSFKQDANKTLMSKFKMMTFMIQLESDSNPDSNQVNPASEYLSKTIEHIRNGKSSFGERDAKMLEEILNEYANENGEIDSEKLYNSFNPAEKKAIKTIQEINEGIRDKAIYTAAVIRGDKIHPLNNYIHLNVLHEYRPDEAVSGVAFIDSYNNSLRPSTKAKSLIARTGKVSPINFDVFASANRGAKFTLMDYYLTQPIRTGRKTINETSDLMKEQKADREQRDIFNAIERAFEESVDNLLTSNFTISSFGDKVTEFMSRQGYRAVLASLPRFVGELSSNVAFAIIAAPKDFKLGVANKDVVLSADASTIMNNVGSKQTNRLFPNDTMSGRLVDTSILDQASGVRGGRAQNDVRNKIQQIYNISLKKYQNAVEVTADALISTPDKMVMRPIWFGSFANEFKRITGNDVDFDKVAANDEKYMAANKEALDEARNVADQKSVLTGASDNAFMGILKGTPKPNQSALLRGFNMFNSFMTRFLIYEYVTARTGVMAAMGNGSITQKQGVAMLAAVATRMTLYTLLTSTLAEGMANLFVDDEDEDDEKTLLQKIGQSMSSSITSMLLGRDFGNATKFIVNQGVEYMNENYLDFLRKGDYDPYKDAIQYTIMPSERKGKQPAFADMLMNMMGPFGPSLKTADLAFRKATEPPKKEGAAQQRVEKEKQIRLPLEVLGNLGMIPLYKDIRKIVNKEIYKDLDNAEKKSDEPMMKEADMKRYYPELWKELYGPGAAGYDEKKLKKEMQKEKSELNRQLKDEMYNYKPKKKTGFGSGEFGKPKSTKSKFGESKFGSK